MDEEIETLARLDTPMRVLVVFIFLLLFLAFPAWAELESVEVAKTLRDPADGSFSQLIYIGDSETYETVLLSTFAIRLPGATVEEPVTEVTRKKKYNFWINYKPGTTKALRWIYLREKIAQEYQMWMAAERRVKTLPPEEVTMEEVIGAIPTLAEIKGGP